MGKFRPLFATTLRLLLVLGVAGALMLPRMGSTADWATDTGIRLTETAEIGEAGGEEVETGSDLLASATCRLLAFPMAQWSVLAGHELPSLALASPLPHLRGPPAAESLSDC